jgi:hypothetical protein
MHVNLLESISHYIPTHMVALKNTSPLYPTSSNHLLLIQHVLLEQSPTCFEHFPIGTAICKHSPVKRHVSLPEGKLSFFSRSKPCFYFFWKNDLPKKTCKRVFKLVLNMYKKILPKFFLGKSLRYYLHLNLMATLL